jgi:DNA-binding IclR family transcriptional regulator
MVAYHHRTVDRVVGALELIARTPDGLGLKDVAEALDVPKSSIQQLLSGLLATGYLDERDKRYVLGPGPFLLAVMSSTDVEARKVSHEALEELTEVLGHNVYIGVRFGDSCVSLDQVGLSSMSEFLAWEHTRRPLLPTAAGKTILANFESRELHNFLNHARRSQPEQVERFLEELPEIRRTGLSYNLGATYPDVVAVATAVRGRHGDFVAAVCMRTTAEFVDDLPECGERMKDHVSRWKL